MNNGTITCQSDQHALQIGGSSITFTNNGTLQEVGSGQLQLINNLNVVGGTLASAGSLIHSLASRLTNVTNVASAALILSDGSQTTLSGTLTNNGNISFASASSNTYLFLDGNVTFGGSGTVTLDNTGLDHIYSLNGGDTLTIGANQTIQGAGDLGTGQTTIVNNGIIRASSATPLMIDSGSFGFTNNGTIRSVSGGALQFNGTVNSSGTVNVGSGTLTVAGNYTQTGGNFLLAGGSVQSSNALNFQGGLIDARGSINAAIMNNAMLRPALGGSGRICHGQCFVSQFFQSRLSIGWTDTRQPVRLYEC